MSEIKPRSIKDVLTDLEMQEPIGHSIVFDSAKDEIELKMIYDDFYILKEFIRASLNTQKCFRDLLNMLKEQSE